MRREQRDMVCLFCYRRSRWKCILNRVLATDRVFTPSFIRSASAKGMSKYHTFCFRVIITSATRAQKNTLTFPKHKLTMCRTRQSSKHLYSNG